MFQDFRQAIRTLLKSPGFSLVAILTLAIGIGANTAMFAVVNAVLLKPLPFADADRLMLVHLTVPYREAANLGGLRQNTWSYPKFRSFLDLQQVFDSTALFAERDFSLSGHSDPEQVRGEVVTDRYPAILGVRPLLGRPFTGEEAHRAGEPPVAMLGYGLWMRRYAGDRGVVGRAIRLNGTEHHVVGILPPGFRGLNGNAEVWVPLAASEPTFLQQAYNHSYYAVSRRRADVTEQAAIGAVQGYGQQVDAMFANRPSGPENAWGASAASLSASRSDGDVKQASIVLLCAAGFVLLIACVNLTNVLVVRAITRRREVAVRMAIGASRLRVVRQFLVESLVLAAAGGLGGVFVATGLLNVAAALLPEADIFFNSPIAPGVPRTVGATGLTRIGASMIEIDASTLMFTSGIVAFTAAAIALVPAFQASSLRPIEAMKTGLRAGTERGFRGLGIRTWLVTSQIAIALVLLAGAGLMVKSAAQLYRTSIGVDPSRVLTVTLTLPTASYKNDNGILFFSQLAERVRGLPGIEAVGLGNCPPVSGGCNSTSIWFPGRPGGDNPRGGMAGPVVGIHWVSPDYFPALRVGLRQGRLFNDQDRIGQPRVVLVSETAARTFWPNETAVGQMIAVGQGGFQDGAEVVGVVADVRYRTIAAEPRPDVYLPYEQSYFRRTRLFVRSGVDEASLVAAIRSQVRALDSSLPLSEIKTMEERVDDAMWRTRVAAWLFSAFAVLALALTAVGIFGVMAQTVTQRSAEIGVRMALGAQRGDMLRLVLGRAIVLSLLGIIFGVVLALGLTRVLGTLLYGVESNDPATFVFVSAALGAVALLASYLPARRAAGVDPIVALRYE